MIDEDLDISAEELAVDELREQGADLSERRRVDHYLYFPTRMHADAAAAEVRRLGFEPATDLDEESDDWLVLATHHTVVSVAELSRLRERFEALAAVHGGEYDGWNIAVDTAPRGRNDDDESWTFDPGDETEEP